VGRSLAISLWSLAQVFGGWCISDLVFCVLDGNVLVSFWLEKDKFQAFSHSRILAFWRFGC
jgi:hypothetical protein